MPTRFVTADAPPKRTQVSVAMPAPAMMCGGLRMFWSGLTAFVLRRSPSVTMTWDRP